MTRILDGKAAAAAIRGEVAAGVASLVAADKRRPGLAAILVGEDPASQVYIRMKAKAAEEVGFSHHTVRLPANVDQTELERQIDRLNEDDEVDGILVQLPLPSGLVEEAALARISPHKDVDGFHPLSVGHLWLDQPGFVSATPAGIIELLNRNGIQLVGASAVIVGRSAIVGKPMAALLLREHCTVTVCHSRTDNLEAVCSQADLLVAAVGRPAIIGRQHVREGAVVVDVGMNRITDRAEIERLFPGDEKRLEQWKKRGSTLVGDVDFTRVAPVASAITPVPGGVGPLTVAMLMANTLRAARLNQGLEE
jgi:methylenetetrahydrofolate dehydrogenase (NADP+)/methenyltetrahydrofolate cyclohydrolase